MNTEDLAIAPDEEEEREWLAVLRRIGERHKRERERERESNNPDESYSISPFQPKFYLKILEVSDARASAPFPHVGGELPKPRRRKLISRPKLGTNTSLSKPQPNTHHKTTVYISQPILKKNDAQSYFPCSATLFSPLLLAFCFLAIPFPFGSFEGHADLS